MACSLAMQIATGFLLLTHVSVTKGVYGVLVPTNAPATNASADEIIQGTECCQGLQKSLRVYFFFCKPLGLAPSRP